MGLHSASFDDRSYALAEMLQEWDVLGVYNSAHRPQDDMEYDDLVSPLRSWLEAGAGPEELSARLVAVLRSDYGLGPADDLAEVDFTRKVFEWWNGDHESDASVRQPAPEVLAAIGELESYVGEVVGDLADVSTDALYGGLIRTLQVRPANARARRIDIIAEMWLVVQIGDEGGRFELGYEASDLDLAKRLIDAVVAGRVSERKAIGRSMVTVEFEDGTTESETGWSSCAAVLVPLPGWRHWARRVRYVPYDAEIERSGTRWSTALARLRRSR